MPILFQPKDGYDKETYEAYGRSIARREDRDFSLKAASLAQEGAMANARLGEQARQFNESRNPSERDQFMASQQQEQQAMQQSGQQSAIALKGQLEQTQLNQAEEMRRQRLERQIEYVQANSGVGQRYTQEDGKDMETFLRTGFDPLQQQARKASMIQQQLANADRMDFNAQQQAMWGLGQNAAAGATANPRFEIRDGEGNLTHRLVPNGAGGLHALDVRPRGGQGESGEARPMTAAQTAGFRRSAEVAVARDPEFIGKPAEERAREVERRFTEWTRQPGANATTPARPIDLPDDAPLSRLPADQRGVLRGLNADEAALTGPNSRLTGDDKTEAQADIARFRSLFRQFGQVASMPPLERAEFLAIARRLDELTGRHREPGRRQPAPPASPTSPEPSAREQAQILGFSGV